MKKGPLANGFLAVGFFLHKKSQRDFSLGFCFF
jgi:hypothetical protein